MILLITLEETVIGVITLVKYDKVNNKTKY